MKKNIKLPLSWLSFFFLFFLNIFFSFFDGPIHFFRIPLSWNVWNDSPQAWRIFDTKVFDGICPLCQYFRDSRRSLACPRFQWHNLPLHLNAAMNISNHEPPVNQLNFEVPDLLFFCFEFQFWNMSFRNVSMSVGANIWTFPEPVVSLELMCDKKQNEQLGRYHF